MKAFYDENVDPKALEGETVAVLGYGIQGRAQALTLRDSGVEVMVGNREDAYRERAVEDGFRVLTVEEASRRSSIIIVLLPDEIQPEVFESAIRSGLSAGNALVFAHGFAVHYGLIEPPEDVDVLLLAPRMPGSFLRERYLKGWGVPAFVSVRHDASGRAWLRLLALAGALGVTRCAAIEASFAQETELDHFSEHFTYPLIFRALEVVFETLVEAGYPPELAVMELHGSEELGQVLVAAASEGLFPMLEAHASPACQVGIAHYWEHALGPTRELKRRAREVLKGIKDGSFARHLVREAKSSYPELRRWRGARSLNLAKAEKRLREKLRGQPQAHRGQ